MDLPGFERRGLGVASQTAFVYWNMRAALSDVTPPYLHHLDCFVTLAPLKQNPGINFFEDSDSSVYGLAWAGWRLIALEQKLTLRSQASLPPQFVHDVDDGFTHRPIQGQDVLHSHETLPNQSVRLRRLIIPGFDDAAAVPATGCL